MTENKAVSPCIYPRCDDGKGEKVLTRQVMCNDCRRLYWQQIRWLMLDYLTLVTQLPKPVRSGTSVGKAPKSKSFGHPAQWASDMAREIAAAFHFAELMLAEHLGHDRVLDPKKPQAARTRDAWLYITNLFDAFCSSPVAVYQVPVFLDLHRKVRGAMGYRRVVKTLPMTCPKCDLAGTMTIEAGGGTDQVTCSACGYAVDENRFDFLAKMFVEDALDKLMADYDRWKAAQLAQQALGAAMARDIEEVIAEAMAIDWCATRPHVELLPPCDAVTIVPTT
ncbi:hypothetical protein SAMN05444157_1611 [Frankineae bacterium MT45]|nr:hypothetical protein SAMN05444157_1611 [Frankineae bacterium MT45]